MRAWAYSEILGGKRGSFTYLPESAKTHMLVWMKIICFAVTSYLKEIIMKHVLFPHFLGKDSN
jgi:hypothetical protein